MDYRNLGSSDMSVSKICLGTMTFGEQNSEAEAHEQMDYAFERGVNFFDTAELYAVPSTAENNGKTEEFIGTWFQKSRKREDVILATKIVGPSKGLKQIRNAELDFSKESIHIAIEGSMKRLKTDYIDVYQLHWPERKANFFGQLGYTHQENDPWEDNFLEILQTLTDLKKAGKIRGWGLSNETPWGVMHFLRLAEKHNLMAPITIQNPYGLLNRSYEVGLAEISMRENIGLLSYSPLGFGLLSGKYHKKQDTDKCRLNKFEVLSRYNNQNCWDATTEYIKIAEKAGISPTTLALSFVNDQPFNASTIIGATTIEQLKENIDSADIQLDRDTLSQINKVHSQYSNPAP